MSNNQPLLSALDTLGANSNPWSKTPAERASMSMACRDTDYIPKVKDAGKTKVVNGERVQVMHNGLIVKENGYQGEWEARIIESLKGHHEPQEEKVFHEVLQRIGKGGLMMELGSWWSFYSMWFIRAVKDGKAVCCEPDPANLKLGNENAKLNDIKIDDQITFYHSAAGVPDGDIIDFQCEDESIIKIPVRTVDSIVAERKIKKIDLLHMDIQGFEMHALQGALETIKAKKLRFLFVSTHHFAISGDPIMHQRCLDFIKSNGGHIIARHTILESCSGDGLIVASFDEQDKDFTVDVTLQPTDDSLFRPAEIDTSILWDSHNSLVEKVNVAASHTSLLERDNNQLKNDLDVYRRHVEYLEKELKNFKELSLLRYVVHSGRRSVSRFRSALLGVDFTYKDGKTLKRADLDNEADVLKTAEMADAENFAHHSKKARNVNKPLLTIVRFTYRGAKKVLRLPFRVLRKIKGSK